MNLHWQHSISARVGRRQFRWARQRAAGKLQASNIQAPKKHQKPNTNIQHLTPNFQGKVTNYDK